MPNFAPTSIDHVALWVDEREALANLVCDHLGMHVIEETDDFTLVGIDAKLGKLTLFDADGPRQRGALQRVVLRVSDLDSVVASLPCDVALREDGVVAFEAPAGLPLGLVEAPGPDFDLDHVVLGLVERETDLEYDLDHVVLALPDPEAAAAKFEELGFERRNGGLSVADKDVRLTGGGNGEPERPLLNHLALLVDSADDVERQARERGFEIADIKDAANTLAVFLWGPDRVKVEYVEHKPGFSLV